MHSTEMKILAFVILVSLLSVVVRAKIVALAVQPHGGIALDPFFFDDHGNATSRQVAIEISNGLKKNSQRIGEYFQNKKADFIFLSTPHGIADQTNFLNYANTQAFGNAQTEGGYGNYSLQLVLDLNNSQKLAAAMAALKQNVSSVLGFGQTENFPIAWGEVIPLYFVPGVGKVPVLIQSVPFKRYDQAIPMMTESYTLGAHLFSWLDKLPERAVVIISGDLAHTHYSWGPYGFNKDADPFDAAIGEWLRGQFEARALMSTAANLVDQALSCGFEGFVMLQGLVDTLKATYTSLKFSSQIVGPVHPSYYGMVSAVFDLQY